MVGVSASVNLPLHHKVQKFCSGTGSPGWSRKKDRKTVVVVNKQLLLLCHDKTILGLSRVQRGNVKLQWSEKVKTGDSGLKQQLI